MSRFKPNVLHGRQYTNKRHQSISQPDQLLRRWVKQSHKILQSHGWPTESSQSPPRLPAPLHHHSDPAFYLTHSTTNLSGGAQGDSAQGLHAAGRPDLTTWSDDNTCRWAQSLSTCFVVSWTLCISTDCWLWGVSVHISTSIPPRIPHSPPSGLRL